MDKIACVMLDFMGQEINVSLAMAVVEDALDHKPMTASAVLILAISWRMDFV